MDAKDLVPVIDNDGVRAKIRITREAPNVLRFVEVVEFVQVIGKEQCPAQWLLPELNSALRTAAVHVIGLAPAGRFDGILYRSGGGGCGALLGGEQGKQAGTGIEEQVFLLLLYLERGFSLQRGEKLQ